MATFLSTVRMNRSLDFLYFLSNSYHPKAFKLLSIMTQGYDVATVSGVGSKRCSLISFLVGQDVDHWRPPLRERLADLGRKYTLERFEKRGHPGVEVEPERTGQVFLFCISATSSSREPPYLGPMPTTGGPLFSNLRNSRRLSTSS